MKVGLIGIAGCGKTTTFSALTGEHIVETWSTQAPKHAHGTVRVHDERLIQLVNLLSSKKYSFSEITFVDLVGKQEVAHKKDLDIAHIREVDCLAAVVRAFLDESVVHPKNSIEPLRDFKLIEEEAILADLELVNNRLERLKKQKEQHMPGEDKLLEICLDALSKEMPLRDLKLSLDQDKMIRGFQLLTKKPIFIILNVSDRNVSDSQIENLKAYAKGKNISIVEFASKFELELLDLDESEREEFEKGFGVKAGEKDDVIKAAFTALGLITFFTIVGEETRAWAMRSGQVALEAAGCIHSDMAKGFIKAEVISLDEFIRVGSLHEARSKGLLKLEGKDYIIKDGDIINFKFSV